VQLRKPPAAFLQHALDSILSLQFPRPEGFVPDVGTTQLSVFTLEPDGVFGPVSFSTNTRRLCLYKAVFTDGAMAIMTITGESLSRTCGDGSFPRALRAIGTEAEYRGGIETQTLCAIRTPLSRRDMNESRCLHRSQAFMRHFIHSALAEYTTDQNHLRVITVDLAGWTPTSSSLPRCIVTREQTSPKDLAVTFGWARGESHSEKTVL
jgi:hypothetical protein